MTARTRAAVDRMAAQRIPDEQLLHDVRPLHRLDGLGPDRSSSIEAWTGRAAAMEMPRRRALIVVGAAAAAIAGSVIVVPLLVEPAARAATPPMLRFTPLTTPEGPMDVLTDLAARAAIQPPAPGSGRFHYIHTLSWNLGTDQTTAGRVIRSGIEPSDRTLWIAEDGSGRIEETRSGRPTPASGTYPPGQLAVFPPANAAPPAGGSAVTAARWFELITQSWATQVVAPSDQSSLLTSLAAQPGMTIAGTVIDRMGRRGIAVITEETGEGPDAPRLRHILILDPQTGMLLGNEKVALTAGSLPVEAPATISYTLWMQVGYASDTDDRPA